METYEMQPGEETMDRDWKDMNRSYFHGVAGFVILLMRVIRSPSGRIARMNNRHRD
jgi:hypothetical protein